MVIIFILFCFTTLHAESINDTASNIYQMDMFSLLSFGLAITALLLSFFMAWLSWEMFKKSNQANENSSQTLIKIEALVTGVQTSISEIVKRAVSYWIDARQDEDGAVSQSQKEMYEKIDVLEKAISEKGPSDTDVLSKVSELKSHLDDLAKGIRESKIRTMFPNLDEDERTVKSLQIVTKTTEKEEAGVFKITVLKPTKIATATIKFARIFTKQPKIETKLIGSPYEDKSVISAKPGTPSSRDCNIHLNAADDLMLGEYVFNYEVKE